MLSKGPREKFEPIVEKSTSLTRIMLQEIYVRPVIVIVWISKHISRVDEVNFMYKYVRCQECLYNVVVNLFKLLSFDTSIKI